METRPLIMQGPVQTSFPVLNLPLGSRFERVQPQPKHLLAVRHPDNDPLSKHAKPLNPVPLLLLYSNSTPTPLLPPVAPPKSSPVTTNDYLPPCPGVFTHT